MDDQNERDINSVAGVLKLYFRGLENPLFPKERFQDLISTISKYRLLDKYFLKLHYRPIAVLATQRGPRPYKTKRLVVAITRLLIMKGLTGMVRPWVWRKLRTEEEEGHLLSQITAERVNRILLGRPGDTETHGPTGRCPGLFTVQECRRVKWSKREKALTALQGFQNFSPCIMGSHGGLGSQVSSMTNKGNGESKLAGASLRHP